MPGAPVNVSVIKYLKVILLNKIKINLFSSSKTDYMYSNIPVLCCIK